MKYFYNEIIDLSVKNDDEYLKKVKMFERQRKEYWKEFKKYNNMLSEDVIKVNKNTHDAIFNIYPIYHEKGIDIAMEIELEWPKSLDMPKGILMHYGVKEFKVEIIGEVDGKTLWYKYGELLMEDDYWTHNIIFHPMPSEMFIKCKEISWIDQDTGT